MQAFRYLKLTQGNVENGTLSRFLVFLFSERKKKRKEKRKSSAKKRGKALISSPSCRFHLAASKGLTECLSLLLTYGAEVNDKNDDGSTALHLATIACQPQCVKVLLQHGANEDCVDRENRTPLHWAASSGCASSVLLLCDQEAFLDVMDNHGRTPLMIAAQGGHPTICSQLLQRGAAVDLLDREGKTALMLACESGSTESAELLLQSGAHVGLADSTGRDALHYATQARSRPLRRLIRSALKRWKRRGGFFYLGFTFPSEGGECSDGEEEEEDPELKEWRSRYRDEKMKVIQLELQLAQKAKECEALSEGRKGMNERIWGQVQEINQLLPEEGGRSEDWRDPSRRYSRDATEEDYYLNLLAEQVQELKKRMVQQQQAREKGVPPMAAAGEPGEEEPKEGGGSRGPHGEHAGRDWRLRGQEEEPEHGAEGPAGTCPGKGRRPALGPAREEVSRFLAELEELCRRVQEETSAVVAENQALKGEAEDSLRSKLQFQAVPSGAVRRSVSAWKKVVAGLERVLAKMEQANATLLEKARSLQGATVGAPSGVVVNGNGRHEENGVLPDEGPLRPKPDLAERKGRPCRKSADLEKEVWDLKQNNGSLMKELTQLSREREKLQEQLRSLSRPADGPSPAGSLVEELRQAVASLSQQLSAEKEESRALRLSLEAQRKEMVGVRDSFLKKVAQEADRTLLADRSGRSTLAAGEAAPQDPLPEAPDAGGDSLRVRQRMSEVKADLEHLREALEGAQASLGGRGKELAQVKQLLGRLATGMAELCQEEEEALRKHEKVRGMLSLRAQALAEELAALQEKYEAARGESARDKEALASERHKSQELLAEAAEHEELAEELRGKCQAVESVAEKLSRRVEELSKSCQDKEAKVRTSRGRDRPGELARLKGSQLAQESQSKEEARSWLQTPSLAVRPEQKWHWKEAVPFRAGHPPSYTVAPRLTNQSIPGLWS
uniref:Ankyrin repeat domain 35 n=1 Tax=Varanus komodoensis TaxID=61221 RepID=A0A8D2IWM8_VARKO